MFYDIWFKFGFRYICISFKKVLCWYSFPNLMFFAVTVCLFFVWSRVQARPKGCLAYKRLAQVASKDTRTVLGGLVTTRKIWNILFDFRNQILQINFRRQSISQWSILGCKFFCFYWFQVNWNYNQKCKYLLHTIRSILLCILSFNSGIWSTCLQPKFSEWNRYPT